MLTDWSDDDGVSRDCACETDGSVVLSGMVWTSKNVGLY
jgi:hypothetical protein